MPDGPQYFEIILRQGLPIGIRSPRQLHRKPLFGDCPAVLEPGITDSRRRYLCKTRQLPGNPLGVAVAFPDMDPAVFSCTTGFNKRHFKHLKIFRL